MSYKNQRVYRLAHELGVRVHRLSLCLPRYELYESGSQVRRSAKSVSANLVEGYGRRIYPLDYIRFLTYALTSNDETQEHITFIIDCHPELKDEWALLLLDYEALGKQLNKFVQKLGSSF